jgi:hypothetical protein
MISQHDMEVLQRKHRELDQLIKEEVKHLSVPDAYIKMLKQRKLAIKTEIELRKTG